MDRIDGTQDITFGGALISSLLIDSARLRNDPGVARAVVARFMGSPFSSPWEALPDPEDELLAMLPDEVLQDKRVWGVLVDAVVRDLSDNMYSRAPAKFTPIVLRALSSNPQAILSIMRDIPANRGVLDSFDIVIDGLASRELFQDIDFARAVLEIYAGRITIPTHYPDEVRQGRRLSALEQKRCSFVLGKMPKELLQQHKEALLDHFYNHLDYRLRGLKPEDRYDSDDSDY